MYFFLEKQFYIKILVLLYININTFKMKKLQFMSIIMVGFLNAQVGVGTPNPKTSFHVDSSKNNPTATDPSAAQQTDDVAFTNISGNAAIGIGTITPTQSIDVVNGNVRVRSIAASTTGSTDRLVVTDTNGILRTASGSSFSTTDSGNRVLRVTGGTALNAQTSWTNNTWTTLILNPAYNPLNSYNASTGEFTVPSDGFYLIYGVITYNLPSAGSGTFDGTQGIAYGAITIDGGRISTTTLPIIRGVKSPSAVNNLTLACNAGVWLKAGEKIALQFLTYGTPNMVANLSDLTVDRNSSRMEVNRIF
ncbi:hypothetical protein [Chryseobacterium sp. JUb7]|uniref:hypothetical protein n=1 Tax=Chryseobacterium sp. JUb7 TaxID=2940599 RepID=UPI002169BFAC|nr:hypothetical protein [Chryseobacterium sp. JUb7]MCS3530019.1 hypothetical protein [Chryseobacterium sp. JUb7]